MAVIKNIIHKTSRGYPEGHISHRKDGDYKKVNGEWVPISKIRKGLSSTEEQPKNKDFQIKRGLTKTEDITDYLEKKLNNLGYEVERKHSGLSGSEYLIIKNAGEYFGKAEGDDVEIRIADHNLPPSYDRNYQGDFDVKSNGKERAGTNGNATNYEDILNQFAHKKGIENTSYDTFVSEKKSKEEEEKQKFKLFLQNKENQNEQRIKKGETLLKEINEETDTKKKLALAEKAVKEQMQVGSFKENVISGKKRSELMFLIKTLKEKV